MDQSKLCGIGIGLLGGWLLFGAWQTIVLGFQAGLPAMVIFDAAFSMRFLAALAAFVAGMAALTELRGGAWFAGIATFVMGVLTLGMILTGTEKSAWQSEIIYLFIMTALFLGVLVARGQNYGGGDVVARELAELAREAAAREDASKQ